MLFGRGFLSLFANDAEVINAGMERLYIMGWSYPIAAFMDCTIAAARGIGRTVVPTIMVIMGSCVFRVVWVYTIFAHFQTITSLTKDGIEYTPIISTTTAIINFNTAFLSVFRGSHNKLI